MAGEDFNRVFAANLRRHRELADLSQADMARLSEIHVTEVSMLERALRGPMLLTAVRLAGVLEVSLDELVQGVRWRPGRIVPGSFQVEEPGGGKRP